MSNGKALGFLRTCIDKRFVEASRTAFEKETQLGTAAYWHETYAGGAARDPSAISNDPATGNNVYADEYAYKQGARTFGWQAHIDGCGGLPGATGEQIKEALKAHIDAMVAKYPDSSHYSLLASGEVDTPPHIDIELVYSPPK